jgi:hypothetical protein
VDEVEVFLRLLTGESKHLFVIEASESERGKRLTTYFVSFGSFSDKD